MEEIGAIGEQVKDSGQAQGELEQALKSMAKGSAILFIGILVGQAANYLAKILIARFWGAEGYGLINLGVTVLFIASTIALMGLPAGITRFIAYYRGQGNFAKVRRTITTGLQIMVPASLLVGILVFLYAGSISSAFFKEPALTPILKLFALTIPFSVLLQSLISSLRGFEKMQYIVYGQNFTQQVGLLVMITAFFVFGLNITALPYAYLLSFAGASLVASLFLRKNLSSVASMLDSSVPAQSSIRKELFLFSWPLILSQLLSDTQARLDVAMVGFFQGATQVGIYSAAIPTSRMLLLTSSAFSPILLPVITRLYASQNKEGLKMVFKTANRWMFYITFPFIILLLSSPDLVLGALFGPEYIAGNRALQILALGILAYLFAGLGGAVINSMGHTKHMLFISLLMISANISLEVLLIPHIGILGAAIGTTSAFLIMSIYIMCFLHTKLRFYPFDLQWIKYGMIMAFLFLPFNWGMNRIFDPAVHVWKLLVLVVGLTAITAITLFATGLRDEDRLILNAIRHKLGLK